MEEPIWYFKIPRMLQAMEQQKMAELSFPEKNWLIPELCTYTEEGRMLLGIQGAAVSLFKVE